MSLDANDEFAALERLFTERAERLEAYRTRITELEARCRFFDVECAAQLRAKNERIAELEARLQRVREWLEVTTLADAFEDVLEGKEPE